MLEPLSKQRANATHGVYALTRGEAGIDVDPHVSPCLRFTAGGALATGTRK